VKDSTVGLTNKEKQDLTEFSAYKRNAVGQINQYIHDMTGAAMGVQEAQRLMRAVPNPGSGIFDGDSPTEFKAKLDDVVSKTKMAVARLAYIKRNGMSLEDGKGNPVVPLERMPALINERGKRDRDGAQDRAAGRERQRARKRECAASSRSSSGSRATDGRTTPRSSSAAGRRGGTADRRHGKAADRLRGGALRPELQRENAKREKPLSLEDLKPRERGQPRRHRRLRHAHQGEHGRRPGDQGADLRQGALPEAVGEGRGLALRRGRRPRGLRGEDGKFYREDPPGFKGGLKDNLPPAPSPTPCRSLADAGAVAGAPGGPPGIVLGGALGRGRAARATAT
jgi:hypothetical protein